MSPFLSAFLAKLVPASVIGKIGAAAVTVAVVAGGGTAALAATSSPDTTTVSNDIEVTSPAPTEATDVVTTDPVETEVSTDPAETDATQTESDDAEQNPVVADPTEPTESTHPDNHGRDVSEVAHGTFDSGREHGRAVSDAAHHHGDDSDAAEAEDESGTDDATVEQSTDVDSGGHGHH